MSEYRIPTSTNEVISATQETDLEQARHDALVSAYESYPADSSDIDKNRIESEKSTTIGAATIIAARETSLATPEFNPAHTAQLLAVGKGVIALRQEEFTLAA